jgi:hypothetical protein
MTCGELKNAIPLFLYGELPFDVEDQLERHIERCDACRLQVEKERALHRSMLAAETMLTSDMLWRSRDQLRERIADERTRRHGWWERLQELVSIRWHVPSVAQPAGALALIAMGFFGARLVPEFGAGKTFMGVAEPLASRVRYVEPDPTGRIQIVVEETRQRTLSGRLGDENIQRLLLAASKDPSDPGLRVESMELLKTRPEDAEIRTALLSSLQHDTNAGVRLKALEGLKGWAGDPEVRQVLAKVLLSDKNPGVRTQVIDMLIQQKEQVQMAGVLQELMRKEDNGYVRMRCQKALHDMKASEDTF